MLKIRPKNAKTTWPGIQKRVKTALMKTTTFITGISLGFMVSFNVVAQENTATLTPGLQVHLDLIHAAIKNDFYNQRCRGIQVSKSLNEVNRFFIQKYRLTATNLVKHHIYNNDTSNISLLKQQSQTRFNKDLSQKGGCQGARDKKWNKQLKASFKNLSRQAKLSDWYPEQ